MAKTEETPWFENPTGPVSIVGVPADEAFSLWTEYRSETSRTGRWPVIVGDVRSRDILQASALAEPIDIAQTVEVARELDISHILLDRLSELMEEPEALEEIGFDFDPDLLQAKRQDDESYFNSESGEVFLALLPTVNGWEAPAHFSYGEWNDYPSVLDHVAMLHYWNERHGTELVALTYDTVELYTAKPILDPQGAKRLAHEWFAYSADNVPEDMSEAAQSLLGARFWFSWWD